MARIRTIKPDAFRSLTLSRVPIEARWLFAGLWTEADDAGRTRDHAGLIKAALLPLDEVPVSEVEGWLTALATEGAICRYSILGEQFLHVPGWEHQRINRPSPSTLPGCPIHDAAPAPREQGLLPVLTPVGGTVNPRRCPEHQTGPSVACGACREARVSHEERLRSQPTLSAVTTKCGEHPEHPALHCPKCEAIPPTAAPEGWRNRKATS